jgi:hypothetical protein
MSREGTGDLQEMHSEELSSRHAISPATTGDSAYRHGFGPLSALAQGQETGRAGSAATRRRRLELVPDWSDEDTDNPFHADDHNFYKVEKWSSDRQHIDACSMPGIISPRHGWCLSAQSSIGRGSG